MPSAEGKIDISPLELERLLANLASGDISAEERELLGRWTEISPENKSIVNLIEGRSAFGADINLLFDTDRDRVWRGLMEADKKHIRRMKFARSVSWGVAASLVAGIVFLASSDFKKESVTDHNELYSTFEPGGKGARLELYDGRVLNISQENTIRTLDTDEGVVSISGEQLDFQRTATSTKDTIETYNTVYTPAGGEFSLVLSDGTKVWLNAGSSITFPTTFKKHARGVKISGEAYFEVAENLQRPFVVSSLGQTLTVLGTSFNVSAYPNESTSVITLISGSVKFATKTEEVILITGQQASYDHAKNHVTVTRVKAELYNAWTQGMFVFFDESLVSICNKLSLWYGIDIDTSSPSLKGIYYSGILNRECTFNKTAELMSETHEIFFREAAGRIYVTATKKR